MVDSTYPRSYTYQNNTALIVDISLHKLDIKRFVVDERDAILL